MRNNEQTFFWYDLETFGLNPFYDRIAQFAGQRTDMDLNPVGDPIILYCRLSADYIPDPAACMVTGITPQEVKAKGLPESEFIEKINDIFSVPGTCVSGFNTLKFDDEFIRNALYRNFMDPYQREWKNGNSRWDIIDLVRACHDLRPQGINWPPANANGNPVFKLTEMTAANHIEQIGAHDAMVDVNATIAVARLIKKVQPKLFGYYLTLRSKITVKNLLDPQDTPKPVLHTCAAFTNPNGCSSLIVPITPHVKNENTIVCFDLSKDIAPLLAAKAEDVFKVPGVLRVAVNRVPFIAPVNTIRAEDYQRLGIDYASCMRRYEEITKNRTALILKIRSNEGDEFENPDDPDFQIYSKFFSDYDKKLFSVVRSTPPEQRLKLNLRFEDPRCAQMLWRHVCRNYPKVLDESDMAKWKSFASTRLLCPPGNPINDINFVSRKIEERMADTSLDAQKKKVLADLRSYLVSLKRFVGLS
ncbi:MAG: exodeoxyribonuclease I [Sphaerochaetaceae bacterium]|nr:exodeoxyribonuclease I [Sphaerochaetaceae bacterium]